MLGWAFWRGFLVAPLKFSAETSPSSSPHKILNGLTCEGDVEEVTTCITSTSCSIFTSSLLAWHQGFLGLVAGEPVIRNDSNVGLIAKPRGWIQKQLARVNGVTTLTTTMSHQVVSTKTWTTKDLPTKWGCIGQIFMFLCNTLDNFAKLIYYMKVWVEKHLGNSNSKPVFLSMSKDTPPRTSMVPENRPLKR